MRKKVTFNNEATPSHPSLQPHSQNILVRLQIVKNPAAAQKVYIAIIVGGLLFLLLLLFFTLITDSESSQPPRNQIPSSVDT